MWEYHVKCFFKYKIFKRPIWWIRMRIVEQYTSAQCQSNFIIQIKEIPKHTLKGRYPSLALENRRSYVNSQYKILEVEIEIRNIEHWKF